MKFRIVEYTHCVDDLKSDIQNSRCRIEYVIEKKTFFGWKEIINKELRSKRISHKTYEDAEAYMMKNYMGHGVCRKIGVEYEYTEYTYYV
jgi:hypothetical protein